MLYFEQQPFPPCIINSGILRARLIAAVLTYELRLFRHLSQSYGAYTGR